MLLENHGQCGKVAPQLPRSSIPVSDRISLDVFGFVSAGLLSSGEGSLEGSALEYRDAVLPTVLLDGLNWMRCRGVMCDVMLVDSGGSEHPAHRAVLAALSPFFR